MRTSNVPASPSKRNKTTQASATGTPWLAEVESNNPPTAGPTIVEIWNTVLFQVTALANCSGGTIHGNRAVRDGAPRVCPTAFTTSSR